MTDVDSRLRIHAVRDVLRKYDIRRGASWMPDPLDIAAEILAALAAAERPRVDADTPIPELLAEVERLNRVLDYAELDVLQVRREIAAKDEEIARLREMGEAICLAVDRALIVHAMGERDDFALTKDRTLAILAFRELAADRG